MLTFADYFIILLFVFLGLFLVAASAMNLEWFFRTNGASTFVNWLGRTGARILYGLLGLIQIVCGISYYFYGG